MPRFHGVMPAIATPMLPDKTIDNDAFQKLCEWQIQSGVHGIVPVGTTGESPTLSHNEHLHIIELCVKTVQGRVPVIAGTGSNNTEEAVFLSQEAQKKNADALLIVTPYYNKPSQNGLFAHYDAIANAVEIPIFIYNIPSRSVVNMEIDTFARLHEKHPHIKGVKDATKDLTLPTLMRAKLGHDFILLSGEDGSIPAFLAQGGHGLISVSCNIAPKLHAQLQNAWLEKDINTLAHIRDTLMPLHEACFIEPSPAPIKYALSLMNKCHNVCRSPIIPLSPQAETHLKECLTQLQIL
jgi:4-hydroxy-tetrahydrodipicolinate synthase